MCTPSYTNQAVISARTHTVEAGGSRQVRLFGFLAFGILMLCARLMAQVTSSEAIIPTGRLDSGAAPLSPELKVAIEQSIEAKEYPKVEAILVREINRNPRSAELLKLAAGVFFLEGNYLNTAIALKKAEKMSGLDDQNRFRLAMSYVLLKRTDWARPELEKLHDRDARNYLYQYWLGRLDYDAQHFQKALERLEDVVTLKPDFVKAHDRLGLCYEALGRIDDAIRSYERAVELNRVAFPGSEWPPMNLGALFRKLGRQEEAQKYLSESIRINPRFAPAHYELGSILEGKGQITDAIAELEEALAVDTAYAQPHYALGRIYRRIGNPSRAEAEFRSFERLTRRKSGKPGD